MWARWLSVILGFWLISSPFVFEYRVATSQLNDLVVGLAIIVVALLSLAVRPLRYLNTALGAWEMLAPFVLGYSDFRRATLNSLIVGLLVISLSLVWDHRMWSPHRRVEAGT